jgi:hypothetical protein
MSKAVVGAMTVIRSAMSTSATPASSALPAVSLDNAEEILAREPSAPLAMALRLAGKLNAPQESYVAANGETVSLRRDPLPADPELIPEAQLRLAANAAVLGARVDPIDLIQWLYRLAQSVERAPVGDALDDAVRRLGDDLRDLPAYCFTEASRRAIARELVFWPSFAKLDPALRKETAALEAERRHLEAVIVAAAAPALPAPAAPVSAARSRMPEEVVAVQARVRAFTAEMASKIDREGKPTLKIRPAYNDRERLIIQYERIVQERGPLAAAAQTRLDALLEQRSKDSTGPSDDGWS